MNSQKDVTVVLVEDDAGHAILIERSLRRAELGNEILLFEDGQKVLDYLFSEGEYQGCEPAHPMVLILDLNLPVVDGFEVLRRIKEDGRTRRVPVVVVTTTDDGEEMHRAYDLGANAYVAKPVENDRFGEAIQNLGLFLNVVTVPEAARV